MFKRLFGRKTSEAQSLEPSMPKVDELPNIEEVFKKARKAAAGEGEQPPDASGRHVVVVTPGRLIMFHPCPPSGSMPPSEVASIEQMMSPNVKRNIAAIAHTEFSTLHTDIGEAIPFFGFLVGFAYIGHSAWVFEGHPTSLAAGCRDADVLIVDGDMVPHLQQDWVAVASGVMRNSQIYVHDRATYSLHRIL